VFGKRALHEVARRNFVVYHENAWPIGGGRRRCRSWLLEELSLRGGIFDFTRQYDGENRPFARFAADGDIATHHFAEFAADNQPESRSAVFAAGGRVGLGEGLEKSVQLFRCHPDASVGDPKGKT